MRFDRPRGLIKFLHGVCRPGSMRRTVRLWLGSWRQIDPRSPWRGAMAACNLIVRVHQEFGIPPFDDTIYRALNDLGFWRASAPSKAFRSH